MALLPHPYWPRRVRLPTESLWAFACVALGAITVRLSRLFAWEGRAEVKTALDSLARRCLGFDASVWNSRRERLVMEMLVPTLCWKGGERREEEKGRERRREREREERETGTETEI